MDMYQKRKMRKENKNTNIEDNKSIAKTNINWYPGHMAKTKRLIKEKYDLIDIVYEVIDSRIPYSSKIKDIDELLKNKPRILIMTKKDLCDLKETLKWKEYYEEQGYFVLMVDLTKNDSINELVTLTHEVMNDVQSKRKEQGMSEKQIRALVVGIPNVGKSTLINRMAGRKAAVVGNNPGVTKNLSWLKTKSNILLLDSPGILWPKLASEEVGLNLASMSAIPRDILPVDRVAVHILNKLNDFYPLFLKQRYNIEKMDNDELENIYDIIGRKMGAIVSGDEIDYDRVSRTILEDIKNERIKGVTFDRKNKE